MLLRASSLVILSVLLGGCVRRSAPPVTAATVVVATPYEGAAEPAAAPEAVPASPAPKSAHAPVECSGSEAIVLRNVVIDGGMLPAVSASGSCQVTIEDSELSSNGAAIAASGSASVVVTRTIVSGSVSLAASGAASIVSLQSSIHGETSSSGAAVLDVR
jgi:hypothetical protein